MLGGAGTAGTTLGITIGMTHGSITRGGLILRGTVRVGASAGAGAASTQDGTARGMVASGVVLGTVLIGVADIGDIITIIRTITTRTIAIPQDAQCRAVMLQGEALLPAITLIPQTVLHIVRQVAGRLPATPPVPLLPLRVAAQEMTVAYVPGALPLHG